MRRTFSVHAPMYRSTAALAISEAVQLLKKDQVSPSETAEMRLNASTGPNFVRH